jgi:signal transduction histidine kinase
VFFEDFEDLVGISIYENEQEVASVYDRKILEEAGLSQEQMQEYHRENPLPIESLSPGGVIVENSTFSPEIPTLSLGVLRSNAGDATSDQSAEKRIVIIAVIRLSGLQRISARSRVFDVYLLDSKGALLAHPDTKLLGERTLFPLPAQLRNLQGRYSAGMTVELEREGTELIGGYSSLEFGGVIAGAEIPKSAAYLASREILTQLIVIGLGMLILAAIISVTGSRRITRPLERLAAATREVAKGQFDIQVPVQSRDEIGTLAGSFNQMASELKNREEALKEAQSQLIQSEKMAAFGQLGAGVAHEVKNPLAGILGCVQLSLRKAEGGAALERNLKLIEKETKRCKQIVENLLKFARREKARLEPMQTNDVLDDAVAIVNHQLELNKVTVEKQTTDGLPLILGNANQLQQVFMNLMMNAQQAMGGEPGFVRVGTRLTLEGRVEVRISDTGPGIPPDIQAKIFEPFFTTKPGGKGTGLGLSVSYGIIKDHGATISVTSVPGDGAAFVMCFPTLGAPSSDPSPEPTDTAEGKGETLAPKAG